ncbi:MAG: hypothetical protein WB952_20590 [Terriglobales bacterium]
MSIHEHLPPQARRELKQVGWTKGVELAKLARRDGQHFDCATWLHKAREMPKEQFRQEVERELTALETEPWEIIYFKLYKSQIPVIERKRSQPERPRLRLDPKLYEQLRIQVLSRDGWRCQSCCTMSNLEVHHKEFRSHSGDDSEQNLITPLYCVPRQRAPQLRT